MIQGDFHGRLRRRALVPALVRLCLGVLALGIVPWARAAEAGLKPERLRVVFREDSFMGVNANDAAAAFKVLAQTVGRRRGFEVVPEVKVVPSDAAVAEILKSGEYDLAVVDPWVFLEYRLDQVVRLDYVAEDSGGLSKEFLVLTRQDAGVKSLSELRGKKMVALSQAHADLGRRWLETQLLESGLGEPGAFFGLVEGVQKPASVVLPVFFGRRDVALVDAASYHVMVELNPQVGRTVLPLMTSEPLSNVLVGTRPGRWESEDFRRELVTAMGELEQDVAGKQVLTLFKIRSLRPFADSQLATARALHAAHGRAALGKGQASGSAGTEEGRQP